MVGSEFLTLLPLERRNSQDAADNGERKLQVEVDGERPNVPEAIPDCSPDCEVYRLDLDRESESIEGMELGNVRLYGPKGAGDCSLAGNALERRDPNAQVSQDDSAKTVGKDELGSLLAARGQ
ncbi:MAG: hypothetical protein FJ038_08905 [Chloroflexi bacterium]|nr:hypothetical protein [Chloroflexota bacterium]